jgi:hypothetical protein
MSYDPSDFGLEEPKHQYHYIHVKNGSECFDLTVQYIQGHYVHETRDEPSHVTEDVIVGVMREDGTGVTDAELEEIGLKGYDLLRTTTFTHK